MRRSNSYAEAVKAVIKERIGKEGTLGRFKLRNGGMCRKCRNARWAYIGDFGHARVLAAYGPMSATNSRTLEWRFGDDAPPREEYIEQRRADSLIITKPKQ